MYTEILKIFCFANIFTSSFFDVLNNVIVQVSFYLPRSRNILQFPQLRQDPQLLYHFIELKHFHIYFINICENTRVR